MTFTLRSCCAFAFASFAVTALAQGTPEGAIRCAAQYAICGPVRRGFCQRQITLSLARLGTHRRFDGVSTRERLKTVLQVRCAVRLACVQLGARMSRRASAMTARG